jgi:radical SAM protein with 4Fe4S-binding SPASM domain
MTTPTPFPEVVRIEPASACNLRCTHCPTGVFDMARTIMKPDVFERVLEQLAAHMPGLRVAVLYHGGEPFLNKRFLEMAGKVKALGIPHVKTVSNGMLVRESDFEAIVRSGLDSIEFSIDADSPEANDAVRRRAKFTHVRDTIIGLVETNRRLGANLEVCVSTTQFQSLEDYTPGQEAPIPAYLERALQSVRSDIVFKTTWAMHWPAELTFEGYDLLHEVPGRNFTPRCSLLSETLSIRADGSVVPCCFDLTSRCVIGNVMDTPLDDIWNGEAFTKFRADFAARTFHPLCANCAFVTGNKFLIPKADESPQTVTTVEEAGSLPANPDI